MAGINRARQDFRRLLAAIKPARPVRDISNGGNTLPAIQQRQRQKLAAIHNLSAIRQFARIQISERLRRRAARHTKHRTAAGAAAIQPQNQPWAFWGAPIPMTP